MRKLWVIGLLAAAGLNGCTVFGVKNPPTVKTTTSAEQYERLLWSAVKAKDWVHVPGFLAENVVYVSGGKTLSKDQVVPYLQSANIGDFSITDVVVKPNGPDMTLNYTLQLPNQTVHAVSVWQHVASGLILIVHTEN